MELYENLIALRKKRGMSQEQLANEMGVSRQAISKWESGSSMPEISKLIELSEFYGVSIDFLLKGSDKESTNIDGELRGLAEGIREITGGDSGYFYESRTKLFGLPLVSINISGFRYRWGFYRRKLRHARGILAVGDVATGVVSVGIFSAGIISIGVIAAGLLTLAILGVGLLCFGIMALGLFSMGVVSIGYIAAGVASMGYKFSYGVAALSKELALGVAACADTAIGTEGVGGTNTMLYTAETAVSELRTFLKSARPDMSEKLVQFIIKLVSYI